MIEGSIILRSNNYKLAILVLMLSLLTGCSEHFSNYVSNLMSNTSDIVLELEETSSDYTEENFEITPQKYAVNTFKEVFELVQAKDSQAIYDMFSEYAKKNADIAPKIEKLVEFMEGEVTEIGYIGAASDYVSVRDGVTVKAAYSATSDVVTDSGVLYWVNIGVITNDEDNTKLGLYYISIMNCNVQNTYVEEHGEWRRNNGAKEDEPQIPENIAVTVNY